MPAILPQSANAGSWLAVTSTFRLRYHCGVTQRLAILVGGGPAPGINSVISAATIRGRLEGVEVVGIRDGFEWIMQGDIDHVMPLDDRRGQPHPLPRRLAPRHLARQPDHGSEACSRTPSSRCCGSNVSHAHHDRRRRHRVLGDEARRARRRPHPRRPRAEDDRQRPRPAAARRHVRLPDRAPLRRRDRQEPDGRREDDVALVLRHRDGPQGRPPRARHRQGGRRDADAHPRGVRRAADPAARRSSTRWSARSSSV